MLWELRETLSFIGPKYNTTIPFYQYTISTIMWPPFTLRSIRWISTLGKDWIVHDSGRSHGRFKLWVRVLVPWVVPVYILLKEIQPHFLLSTICFESTSSDPRPLCFTRSVSTDNYYSYIYMYVCVYIYTLIRGRYTVSDTTLKMQSK